MIGISAPKAVTEVVPYKSPVARISGSADRGIPASSSKSSWYLIVRKSTICVVDALEKSTANVAPLVSLARSQLLTGGTGVLPADGCADRFESVSVPCNGGSHLTAEPDGANLVER